MTHLTKRVRLIVRCEWKGRRLSHAELQQCGDRLALIMAQGLNPDNLTAWLKSCAAP
jgi:hypothetical protein